MHTRIKAIFVVVEGPNGEDEYYTDAYDAGVEMVLVGGQSWGTAGTHYDGLEISKGLQRISREEFPSATEQVKSPMLQRPQIFKRPQTQAATSQDTATEGTVLRSMAMATATTRPPACIYRDGKWYCW